MSIFDAIALQTDKPHRVLLIAPNGLPWRDKDGKQAYIDVMSSYSEVNAEGLRYIAEQRAAGKEYPDQDSQIREAMPFYVRGWYLLNIDGTPLDIEFTVENARALFADQRCDYITGLARAAVVNNANFIQAPPTASSVTPKRAPTKASSGANTATP